MNNDNNRLEDFFFFFLKLLCVCLAVVAMYLAYDMYTDKKINSHVEDIFRALDYVL